MDTSNALPVHPPVNDELQASIANGGIRVAGMVNWPHVLSFAQLDNLPRVRLVERFVCEEGWSVDGLVWEGVPLREIIALGEPLSSAQYVRVYANNYWIAFPLAQVNQALLCNRLNGAPLTQEHGAPWRLVISGGACFTSVKWVSMLELAAEPGDDTAERIARSRIATNDTDRSV